LGIGFVEDEVYDDVVKGGHVECSSVANNPVNLCPRMIDGSEESWFSHPEVEKVYVTLRLPKPATIN
jgi:hypothetical protein